MTRVIGFSLKLEGSTTTVTELGKINKALDEVGKQINGVKKIDGGILRPLFDGQKEFKKALEDTNKVLIQQDKLLNNLGKGKTVDQSAIDSLMVTIKKLKKEIEQLKVDLNNIKSPTINVASGDGLDKLKERAHAVNMEIMAIAPAFEQLSNGSSKTFLNRIAEIDIKLKQVKANITSTKASSGPDQQGNLAQLLAEEKALTLQKTELNKELKNEISNFDKLGKKIDATSIIGMRNELRNLKNEFLLLSEEEKKSADGLKKFAAINDINTKLNSAEQAIGDFRRNVGNYKDAVSQIIPTLERLQKEGVITQKSLLEVFRGENKQRVDQLTADVNELSAAFEKMSVAERKSEKGIAIFNQLDLKLRELGSTATVASTGFNKFGQSALSIGNVITGGLIGGGFVVAFQTAFQGIRKAIDISAELSDVESDVRKTTGLTIEQVKQLEASFKNLDTRTSTTELLKISAVAGQLGVTGAKGIEDFTKALNVVSVALGDDLKGGVDEVSRDLSRLSNVLFGATTDGTELSENILHIGNSLNVLASTSAATGDNIVDFASRIGRSLVPLGVTAEEVLALSATFDELSIRPEQGATAINNLIKDIGANTHEIATTLKLNEAELKKSFNTDPLKAFDIVLKRITELSGGDKTKLLTYLKDIKQTGQGVSDVFLALGKNSDIFDRNLINSTSSLQNSNSLMNEYSLKNENLAGTFDKLSKKMQDLSTNQGLVSLFELIGNKLLGLVEIIGTVGEGLTLLGKKFSAFFDGVLLSSDFSKLDAKLKKTFGVDLSNEFDNGKYISQQAELAEKLLDIRKNNALIKQEIGNANRLISEANFNLKLTTNESEINGQKAIIKTQEEIIKRKKAQIVDENAFSKNFIQTVAFIPDKDLTAQELEAKNKELKKIQDDADNADIQAAKAKADKLAKDRKDAYDKQQKLLEDQLKRINDLQNRIDGLNIDNIDNEFEQKIADTKKKTSIDVAIIESQLKKLEGLKVKTSTDNTEIEKLKEVKSLLEAARDKQITIIKADQAKAVEDARQELIKLKSEIDQIINDGTKISIESQINTAQFDLGQENRTIEITYTTNLSQLKADLASGLIKQKEFDAKVLELDKNKLNDQLKSLQDFKVKADALYQALYDAELRALDIKDAQIRANIELERQSKNLKALEDQRTKGVSQEVTNEKIVKNNQEALNAIIKQDIQYNADEAKLNEARKTSVQKNTDDITKIQIEGIDKVNEATSNKSKKLTDNQREGLEALKNQALSIAQQIADAIYEIDKAQIERQYNSRIEGAERERDAQLKLHKGNAQEEERINREFETKKRRLEKDKFEENKKVAIEQAKINGALAALNAIATSKNIYVGLVLAAGAAVTTAIQIAKIRATSFAEGGFGHSKMFRKSGEGGYTGASQAPPDHTGKRPVGTAVFHANEYTATEGQVTQNKDIFDIMEADRKAMQTGRSSQLRKNLYAALEQRELNTSILTRQRKHEFPVLYQANYFRGERGNSQISISPESMNEFAEIVASKTEAAILKGTKSGYQESTQEIIKDQIRNTNLTLKKAV